MSDEEDVSRQCAQCSSILDDIKQTIKCTNCRKYFHLKCEEVNPRGLHLRRNIWKCTKCSDSSVIKNRKRSRSDWDNSRMEDDEYDNKVLFELITAFYSEFKCKLDEVIEENKKLRQEIIDMKTQQQQQSTELSTNKTYANVTVSNTNKCFIIKSKNNSSDATKIKEDLRTRIDPAKVGSGISMGRKTKKGELIVHIDDEDRNVQSFREEIEKNMGDQYEVVEKRHYRSRIKIVGINEHEHDKNDNDLINKISKQNNLGKNVEIKILHKSAVFRNRFHLVIETDQDSFKSLISKERIFLGWSSCRIFEDFGIIRCFKCNKYGHFQKDCKETEDKIIFV